MGGVEEARRVAGLTIERTTGLQGADRRAFDTIYEASFPDDERVPTAALADSIASGRRLAWVARLDGRMAGLAVVVPLDGVDTVLLEYLAVDPTRRSAGIGAHLLGTLRRELPGICRGCTAVILEVEPPDGADGADRIQRHRRIAFYLANGAVAVDTGGAYRAPVLDGRGTRRYDLLALGVVPYPPPSPFGSGRLRRCVERILIQSYDVAAGDPLIAAVTGALPA
jgi:GNAT superfamily N-acetyltransferase